MTLKFWNVFVCHLLGHKTGKFTFEDLYCLRCGVLVWDSKQTIIPEEIDMLVVDTCKEIGVLNKKLEKLGIRRNPK